MLEMTFCVVLLAHCMHAGDDILCGAAPHCMHAGDDILCAGDDILCGAARSLYACWR